MTLELLLIHVEFILWCCFWLALSVAAAYNIIALSEEIEQYLDERKDPK